MGIWTPSEQRRAEIVEAALGLLAEHSLEEVTTRQLARALRLSQPALFRHFRSREELLLAVVARVRADLEAIAASLLSQPSGGESPLERLGAELLAHVETHPGLPRLLFGTAGPKPGPVAQALRQIVSMQSALVAELVRQGQRDGRLDRGVDAGVAATAFVGLLQGLVLDWELAGRPAGLPARWKACHALWHRAVRVGGPAPIGDAAAPPRRPEPASPAEPLAALDVRPILARGLDPLETILAALEALPPSGLLALTAPFRPAPLLALLAGRGFRAPVEQLAPDRYLVLVTHADGPAVDDLRDLPAPDPLEHVLTAAAALEPGQVLLARTPRNPRLLADRLRERPVRFGILELADGSAIVRVEAGA